MRLNIEPEFDREWARWMMIGVATLALVVIMFCNAGCATLGAGQPARGGISMTVTKTLDPETGAVVKIVEHRSAFLPELPANFTGELSMPTMRILPDGTLEIGASALAGKLRELASMANLYWAGVGLIVLGAACGWFLKSLTLGGAIAALGASLMAMVRLLDVYPWVGAIPLGLLLIVGGLAGYQLWRGLRARKANEAIVPAVEASIDADTIKENVEANAKKAGATDAVKAEVTATKKKIKKKMSNG